MLLFSTEISVYLGNGQGSAGIQFQGEPLQRERKVEGWENLAIFDWNLRLSRKRYEIGSWLQWNVNRKSYALLNDDIFNDVDGPLSRFSRSRHFWSRIFQKRCILGTVTKRTLIGNHTQSIEWYHFQRPWLANWLGFQGRDIYRHWISQKRHEIEP